MKAVPESVLLFERSARRDFRWWMMALVGAVFLVASQSVRPEDNCSEDGECAPWLVPVAGVMGALALAGGAGPLLANTRRGSRIDTTAGTLEWWQGRTARHPGDHGAIALCDIAYIRIERRYDSDDSVSLYDRAGERQAYFDSEVIPWRHEEWVRHVKAMQPSIEFQVLD
ncbi:MAG: hypothetical protein B7Y36_16450 [Novosphingobium sp. 28-62-57]|nr:MAG: hypothetical protein B7Z36_00195 [Novosphingobium sp. 12-63-9]OYZ08588.1 MAG: hypothetical protein B7Y36_16450 [Novosphingobium sp. 28-62-57]